MYHEGSVVKVRSMLKSQRTLGLSGRDEYLSHHVVMVRLSETKGHKMEPIRRQDTKWRHIETDDLIDLNYLVS